MATTATNHGRPAMRGRPRGFDRDVALRRALEVFWRLGYERATVAVLCEAMGIASPSLYCAFGGKTDLFLEAMAYYREEYWRGAFTRFRDEPDIRKAVADLFATAARILLAPNAPCGCFTVFTAMLAPADDERIMAAVTAMRRETRQMFRDKLMAAVNAGLIPADCDIPAITGALVNFFEGLSIHAHDDLCLAELLAVAAQGVRLLPEV